MQTIAAVAQQAEVTAPITAVEFALEALHTTFRLVQQELQQVRAEPAAPEPRQHAAQQRNRLSLLRLLAGTARELGSLARAQLKPARRARAVPASGAAPEPEVPLAAEAPQGPGSWNPEGGQLSVWPVVEAVLAEPTAPNETAPPDDVAVPNEATVLNDVAVPHVPGTPDVPRVTRSTYVRRYTKHDVGTVPDDELRACIPAAYWAWKPNATLRQALEDIQRWYTNQMSIPGLD